MFFDLKQPLKEESVNTTVIPFVLVFLRREYLFN